MKAFYGIPRTADWPAGENLWKGEAMVMRLSDRVMRFSVNQGGLKLDNVYSGRGKRMVFL